MRHGVVVTMAKEQRLFASVEDGIITAVLTEENVRNSCKSFELFKEVNREGRPITIGKYQEVIESFEYKYGGAFSVYTVRELPIDILLAKAKDLGTGLIGDVELVTIIKRTIEKMVDASLDSFVRVKGYSSMATVAGYINSEDAEFKADSVFATGVRDKTYRALYNLLTLVMSGAREIPATYTEMQTLLPVAKWPAN